MNRREFLKKSLEGIVLGSIPLIYNCDRNPLKSELEDIFIDKTLIADAFGYYDGVASETELNEIDNYFKSNPEAWGLGKFPDTYYNKNELQLSEAINALKGGLAGPFKNETELRKYKEELLASWANWLGIYVFDSGNNKSEQYRLKYYFKASGDFDMQKGEFIPMIVKDDCKQINH
jgi:hypothetical protein